MFGYVQKLLHLIRIDVARPEDCETNGFVTGEVVALASMHATAEDVLSSATIEVSVNHLHHLFVVEFLDSTVMNAARVMNEVLKSRGIGPSQSCVRHSSRSVVLPYPQA